MCVNDTADYQLVVRATTVTTADGLKFYCSAINEFGTIESNQVRIKALKGTYLCTVVRVCGCVGVCIGVWMGVDVGCVDGCRCGVGGWVDGCGCGWVGEWVCTCICMHITPLLQC